MANTCKINTEILKKSTGKLGGWIKGVKEDKHPVTDIYVQDSKLHNSVIRGLLG